jgi:D-alanine-D-alanine ligase-like ATP-grasp enzyme
MKTYNFVMRVSGSAKGTVKANNIKEARKAIEEGQWDDIDINVEDVIEVEHLAEKQNKR